MGNNLLEFNISKSDENFFHANNKRAKLLELNWRQALDSGETKVKDRQKRMMVAQLLENEQRLGLVESASLNPQDSTDVGIFQTTAIPIVKRVYANLIAPDIVGVQPMNGPSSLAFFLKYQYKDSGTEILKPGGTNRIFGDGVDESDHAVEFDPFYSASFQTIAFVTTTEYDDTNATAGVTIFGDTGSGALKTDTAFGGEATSTGQMAANSEEMNVQGTYTDSSGVDVAVNQTITWTDTGGEVFLYGDSTDGISFTLTRPDYSTGSDAGDGNVVLKVYDSGSAVVALKSGAKLKFRYTRGAPHEAAANASDAAAGLGGAYNPSVQPNLACDTSQLPFNLENVDDIREVNFTLESVPIAARTRKLRTGWTFENAQDLKSLQGIDAEEELTKLLSTQIQAEIDREIIGSLLRLAVHRATWYTRPRAISTEVRTNIKDWYETLVFKITEMGNAIYKSILRGGANFVVCDPWSATFLESVQSFQAESNTMNTGNFNMSVVQAGTFASKWKIFKDPLFPKGHILVGYKGANPFDTGFVYAPYVPLVMFPTVFDPQSLVPRKGIMTRYGSTPLLDGKYFYGVIRVLEGNTPTTVTV